MDVTFPNRAADPEELEGGRAGKTSRAGVDRTDPEADTRTHGEETRRNKEVRGGGMPGVRGVPRVGKLEVQGGEIRMSMAAA